MRDLNVIANENKGLPMNISGHTISPRYVPEGSSYLSVWRLWLRQTPKAEWPAWLVADLRFMKIR